MLKFRVIKIGLLTSQTIVLLVMAASNPAVAQGYNFVDLNQSRQFFNQGNRNIEREIKTLEENERLPKIKLPQNYWQFKDIDKVNSLDRRHKLQSMLHLASDDWNNFVFK